MKNSLLIVVIIVVLATLGVIGTVALVNNDKKDAATTQEQADEYSEGSQPTETAEEPGNQAPAINAESAATNEVTIENSAYSPASVEVKKGTKVTWTNQDSIQHDVTPDESSGEFKKSELLSKGESYSVTFNTAGTYTYHCTPHPFMKGTVVVTE